MGVILIEIQTILLHGSIKYTVCITGWSQFYTLFSYQYIVFQILVLSKSAFTLVNCAIRRQIRFCTIAQTSAVASIEVFEPQPPLDFWPRYDTGSNALETSSNPSTAIASFGKWPPCENSVANLNHYCIKQWSSSLEQFNPLEKTSELHVRTLIHHFYSLLCRSIGFSIFDDSLLRLESIQHTSICTKCLSSTYYIDSMWLPFYRVANISIVLHVKAYACVCVPFGLLQRGKMFRTQMRIETPPTVNSTLHEWKRHGFCAGLRRSFI